MSIQDAGVDRGLSFPSNALSEVPFRVYTDPEQYRLEQERIFKGPTWSYLCLTAEIPEPGDWVATTIGEVAVVVARGPDGAINAFVNRCAHRGNLLCLTEKGHGKEITCIYHGWSYDLAGKLTGVAFERGIKRQGGMPPEFRKDDHHLQRLRVAELSGLVFGTFSDEVEDLETYLGPLVVGGVRRVLNRPARIIGRSTQILPNNWKLYAENVKDTYHASILHAFLTTFRINRLAARQHQYRRQRRESFQPGQDGLRRRGRRVQGGAIALRHRPQAGRQFDHRAGRRIWRPGLGTDPDRVPEHGIAADPQHDRGAGVAGAGRVQIGARMGASRFRRRR